MFCSYFVLSFIGRHANVHECVEVRCSNFQPRGNEGPLTIYGLFEALNWLMKSKVSKLVELVSFCLGYSDYCSLSLNSVLRYLRIIVNISVQGWDNFLFHRLGLFTISY